MSSGELAEVGYVVRTHGVKGHLRIIFTVLIKELSVSEALFLLQKGNKMPFFIKEIEYLNPVEAFIQFEDINTKEDAGMFAKKPVFAKQEMLMQTEGDEETIEGYIVVDQDKNEIGRVVETLHMQEYDLLEVEYNGKNILLPFHDDIIINWDKNKKIICLNIVEGLLEL